MLEGSKARNTAIDDWIYIVVEKFGKRQMMDRRMELKMTMCGSARIFREAAPKRAFRAHFNETCPCKRTLDPETVKKMKDQKKLAPRWRHGYKNDHMLTVEYKWNDKLLRKIIIIVLCFVDGENAPRLFSQMPQQLLHKVTLDPSDTSTARDAKSIVQAENTKDFFCLFVFVIFGNCTGRIALVCIIVEAEDLFLIRRPTLLLTKRRTSEWRWRYDALRRQPRQHNRKCTMWKWQNFECFMDDCDWRKIGRERGSVPLIYIYIKRWSIYTYIYIEKENKKRPGI